MKIKSSQIIIIIFKKQSKNNYKHFIFQNNPNQVHNILNKDINERLKDCLFFEYLLLQMKLIKNKKFP